MGGEFVVYLTMYRGNKMPRWYIGSSTKQKVLEGYNGSKEFSKIYKEEQIKNKHLFKTRILSYHNTREEVLIEELRVQKIHNVVLNKKYINKSFAQRDGCFGMDNSGKNNPMYGVPSPGIGSKWMNKNGINKKVKKSDVEHYSEDGWVFGRIKMSTNINEGVIYLSKDNITHRFYTNNPEKIEEYISNGWVRGVSSKLGKESSTKNKIRLTNINTGREKYVKTEDLEIFIESGEYELFDKNKKYYSFAKKCSINNIIFNSLSAAQQSTGLSVYLITKLCNNEEELNYFFIKEN